MLRPCVFTDEISQDLERALDVAADFSVRTVELRGVWDKSIVECDDEDIARIRDLLSLRGFSVACIASPFFKCDLPGFGRRESQDAAAAEAIVERHIEMLRRAADLCHVFGAPVVRGFAFWRPAREPAGLARDASVQTNRHLRDKDTPGEIWQRMLARFAEPVKIIEAAGVTFALENEADCGVARGDEAARFIEALGSPSFRVTWDPGNAFCAGEVPYPDGYERIRRYVAHVHVKDARVDPDTGKARWCRLGAGQVDWAGQFQALVKDGYDGAVSLETHYTPPGATREQGSRECLAGMADLLRQAGWRES
jgi:sugar phosphate isomerase/epimerase